MLAFFHGNVIRDHGPDALFASSGTPKCSSCDLAAKFQAVHKGHDICSISFEDRSSMAYYHYRQALLTPRTFAAIDDMFCIFEGALENLPFLRHQYGLSKLVNEAVLVIEAYRALRDRAPYPPDKVVSDLSGHFTFILYDKQTQKIFTAVDSLGKVPLFWGTTSDGFMAFSDAEQLIKETCGNSFASFPQGCYFSSDDGLRSFEHPWSEVKVVPRLDSQGQAHGSTFKVVDADTVPKERIDNLSPWGVA